MKKCLAFLLAVLLLLSAAPALGEEITLSFIGDCCIGEDIRTRDYEYGYSWVLTEYGLDWPFSLVRDTLEKDDFTFANLEVVLTERTSYDKDARFPLAGKTRYAKVLRYSGVDAVNTVNNHCFDFYVYGYQDTMKALDTYRIPHFGSIYIGDPNREQDLLLTKEVKGIKIGAVGFSYPQQSDLKRIKARIQTLREEGCDLVVVSLHWGREKQPEPEDYQIDYAQQVIDMGADIVWGHHPHVLQPIQIYKGKIIMYSVGNFTFGSISAAVDPDTAIFQLTYETGDKDLTLKKFQALPCITTRDGDFRPHPLTKTADKRRVYQKLVSEKFPRMAENIPSSFLKNGIILFQDGEIVK